ncbi:MAG: D-alanine--D-alanine ligase A, partial [Chloroflexi bacterium]|nr:D-alanine--D-alanine ligase A [Chloroflexota bacterium]
KIFRLLGARSYARVDFLLTETNDIYCLEINTSPGFTTSSMFPILCENSGLAFKQLITRLAISGEQAGQDVRPHD